MNAAEQIHQPLALLDNFEAVEPRVAASSHIALFLDFDGTLSRIVPIPQEAEVDAGIRATLRSLTERADFTVSIVSGRALADVRERIALKNVIYVGNHGL